MRFNGRSISQALVLLIYPSCLLASELDRPIADDWWSVRAPQRHGLPDVKLVEWPKQPIDYFILASLEDQHLEPSEPAGDREWLRRVTFDLTGLPPAFDDVEAFVRNASPDRYAEKVRQLLDSPRFGERMASLWLNLSRYAEDQAHQVGKDTKHFYPNAYHYRSWVVDSFNRDLPYDQFIRYQLAADLDPSTLKSDLASLGFLGLGPKYYNRGRLDVMAEEWSDQVDTVMRTFQGLTIACARCHDHKYDPVTMEDYYGLAGVFAGIELVNVPFTRPPSEVTEEDIQNHRFTAHLVRDKGPKDLPVYERGNVDLPGATVPRRFVGWVAGGSAEPFGSHTSGRLELAERIASRRNPLTARVYVNRIWTLLFGKPLVGTTSNFGTLGDLPSHPDLLDDMAVRFMQNGWSTKELIREWALSATYRQTSLNSSTEARDLDPENRFLWKMNRKRLTVEMWRDAVLCASGQIDFNMNGPSMELDDPANRRRTVYGRISRLKLNDLLMQMDYPDANAHAPVRAVTTTPLQKLFALNSPFMIAQARALLEEAQGPIHTDAFVRHVYRAVLSRDPNESELSAAGRLLMESDESDRSENRLLLSQALLISNEMLYVD